MRRTLTLTRFEMDALINAVAEYEAAWGDDKDPRVRAVLRAQQRVIDKWHAAGRRTAGRRTAG